MSVFDLNRVDVEAEDWQRLLERVGKSEAEIRDGRYDCVVHLQTAACGAESFYSQEGKEARREEPDVARRLDELVMKAWAGHPQYVFVDNSTGFDAKLDRTIKAVLSGAGLQDPRGGDDWAARRRKFVLPKGIALPELPKDVNYIDFQVEHRVLLPSDDGATFYRLKRRTNKQGQSVYTLVTSFLDKDDLRCESMRNLSAREYESMLRFTDPDYEMVVRARRCFIWDGHYYQVDRFLTKQTRMVILEAYIPQDASLPPFLPEPVADVTNDKCYKLVNLSYIYN